MSKMERMFALCKLMGIEIEYIENEKLKKIFNGLYDDENSMRCAVISLNPDAEDMEHVLAHEIGHAFLTHIDLLQAEKHVRQEEEASVKRFADGLLHHIGRMVA